MESSANFQRTIAVTPVLPPALAGLWIDVAHISKQSTYMQFSNMAYLLQFQVSPVQPLRCPPERFVCEVPYRKLQGNRRPRQLENTIPSGTLITPNPPQKLTTMPQNQKPKIENRESKIPPARPGYHLTKLGWLPKEWEVVKLEELQISLIIRIWHSSSSQYADEGIPLLRGANHKKESVEVVTLMRKKYRSIMMVL